MSGWVRHRFVTVVIDRKFGFLKSRTFGTYNKLTYLEPQTTMYKWMFGETIIFYIKIWNHPIETTIYKWLFGVPGTGCNPWILSTRDIPGLPGKKFEVGIPNPDSCFLEANWLNFLRGHEIGFSSGGVVIPLVFPNVP